MTDWDKIMQEASDKLTLAFMEVSETLAAGFREVREALGISESDDPEL